MRALVGTTVACAVLAAGCICPLTSTNPATGHRQIDLMGEQGEIEEGRKADDRLTQSIGTLDDPDMAKTVSELGTQLAHVSERPQLPWTFRILDDPAVNAFALPGGYIYVTRGLLTHLNSRYELAGVISHEVGHVTARHSVTRMSKGLLAGVGVGVLGAIDPEGLGSMASAGAALLFLSYSRQDELEADSLGLRYLARSEWPPGALLEVFDVLARVEAEALQGERLPNLLRTHPVSEERRARLESQIAGLGLTPGKSKPDPEYLAMLDGMTFGPNPREGFFIENAFVHPELHLRFDIPKEWKGINQREAVLGVRPERDALVRLSYAKIVDLDEAMETFAREAGVTLRDQKHLEVHGREAVTAVFDVAGEPGKGLRGWITMLAFDKDKTLELLGLSRQTAADELEKSILASLHSVRAMNQSKIINVKPMHLEMVALPSAMTLKKFYEKYPSSVSIEKIAIINHVQTGDTLPKGAHVKRVVGFNPATATHELLQ